MCVCVYAEECVCRGAHEAECNYVSVMGMLQPGDDLVAVVDVLETDGSARSETMPKHWGQHLSGAAAPPAVRG